MFLFPYRVFLLAHFSVFRFAENSAAVIHRFELPTKGWSCCWLNEKEVAVGLFNGLFFI